MTGMTRRTNTNVNIRRLYWTLGNYPNDQHFVIVSESLNTLKSQIWQGHNPVADSEMTTLIDKMVDDGAACEALCALRKVNSVLLYFNEPSVHNKFARISNDFRSELLRQYQEYKPGSTADDVEKISNAYDEILRIELDAIKNGVSNFVTKYAARIRDKLEGLDVQWAKEAIEIADNFENMAVRAQMETAGFSGL